jgi:hypothetical protein
MATIERQAPRLPSAAPSETVFSADDGRRERALRVVGRLAAVIAGLWLLALLVGAMGFGHLPGLPGSALLDRATGPAKPPSESPRANRAEAANKMSAASRAVVPIARAAQVRAGSPSARTRAPAHRPPPPAAPPPPAGQVSAPAVVAPPPGKPQGRAVRRHGNQAQPAPPPPGYGNGNGNGNGQAVVNPGRLKHQLPPPPPPPPPPPKKP